MPLTTLKIIKLANDGEGIALYRGQSCFVYNALPGEEILAKVFKNKRNAWQGEVVKILKSSSHRQTLTPNSGEVIGLTLSHLKYPQTLQYKNKKVAFHLRKVIPNFDDVITPIKTAGTPLNYRNETTIPLGLKNNKIIWGLYKPGTNQIVATKKHYQHLPLINKLLNKITSLLALFYRQVVLQKQLLVRFIHLRINPKGMAEVTLFLKKASLPQAFICKLKELNPIIKAGVVLLRQNDPNKGEYQELFGPKYFPLTLNETNYLLTANSFFQLNYPVAALIYRTIKEFLLPNQIVLDAYAGVGAIGLYLSRYLKKCYMVELNNDAVQAASAVIETNNLTNVKVISSDCTKWLVKNTTFFDTIIFDPPRSGLTEEIITYLKNKLVPQIIYLSCNIETLARDLKKLRHHYKIIKIIPYDMFPYTAHVETIVLMQRVKS